LPRAQALKGAIKEAHAYRTASQASARRHVQQDCADSGGVQGSLSPVSRERFGHPRGVFVLAGTECWERISFNGMQALLVLYMVGQVLLPGHAEHVAGFQTFRSIIEHVTGPLSAQALALQVFGLYIGLVSFTPVFGGLLGDRLLGRRVAVTLGALLMTTGHFCMAFERSFLWALLLLIVGAGCLRGNLASQVGALYAPTDSRRATAFQVYYLVINCASFIAPLITGALAKAWGWQYGFGFAGVGMLFGLFIYLAGQRDLPPNRARSVQVRTRPEGREWRVVCVLALMVPLLALFWIAQAQVWNTYMLWARDHVDMLILGWAVPVPWLSAFDNLAAVLLLPPILLLWRWQGQRGRAPDEISKLATGCLIFAAAVTWLAVGCAMGGSGYRVTLLWVLVFHVCANVGWVYFAPSAVTLFTRAAPAAANSTMVGVYYLSLFAGSTISGRLGALYEHYSAANFWLIHAAIVGAGGLLLLLIKPWLRRELTSQAVTQAS
jgi:proton-dependent oligopeptide transporter, POT family